MKVQKIGSISFKAHQSNISNYIKPKRLQDTFIKLAKVDTASSESDYGGKNIPSTKKQVEFAHSLAKELQIMGLDDVAVNEFGILTATLQGNIGHDAPIIGLIAHMDTSEDAPSDNINPIVHKYSSGDIKLKNNVTLTSEELQNYKGQTIITSDGTTLIGADDKAGIAEILEALKVFQEHPELKRPTLRIAFTPDEEIGYGVENFDVKKFGADVAYTIDGCAPEDIDTETFNAFNPKITIKGNVTHLGSAYKKLVNSISVANSIINKLPKDEVPEKVKDKQGYIHVDGIEGNVSKTTIKLVVRDFDYSCAKKRVEQVKQIVDEVQKEHPDAQIKIDENEMYHNMKKSLSELPEAVEYAKEGIKRSGLTPKEAYIRGGTDGAELSEMGLPCPNLGNGSENFHTVREFASLEGMTKCCENIINTVMIWAENAKEIMPKITDRRQK